MKEWFWCKLAGVHWTSALFISAVLPLVVRFVNEGEDFSDRAVEFGRYFLVEVQLGQDSDQVSVFSNKDIVFLGESDNPVGQLPSALRQELWGRILFRVISKSCCCSSRTRITLVFGFHVRGTKRR